MVVLQLFTDNPSIVTQHILMPPGGLSHLLPTHFPDNLPSPPNIVAFNTRLSDTALGNFLHCERLLLISTFYFPSFNHSSTPYSMSIYIPREPLGNKLDSRPFSRIIRRLYALSLSCPDTGWLLQRPLIEFPARRQHGR